MNRADPAAVVYTDKARCRDCYRCLRACPVKAIAMHAGQARIVPEACIACGTCVRECPQHAKHFRSDVETAKRLLATRKFVAVSVAPSFASAWEGWQRDRLASALRRLGFRHVAETAVAAHAVATATAAEIEKKAGHGCIASACPAVVSYVERCVGELTGQLAPVVSPMILHAQQIKAAQPEAAVVFVGPCVAKKAEAERPEYAGIVDCVLTFAELDAWLQEAGVDFRRCEASAFDAAPSGASRFFPVPGGLLKTAGLPAALIEMDADAPSGFAALAAALAAAARGDGPRLLEPLFCEQGCVAGPGMPQADNRFAQRRRLIEYASAEAGGAAAASVVTAVRAAFAPAAPGVVMPSEDEIQAVLADTGKQNADDQLDCGACGYESCRAKAIAVVRGLAEPEMCMPHMRRLAERRTDRIIETSPNGIVILNAQLRILSMNAAFRRMFTCSDAVLGKPIAYLLDPEPFEALASGETGQIQRKRHFPNYNLNCHQIAYALREEQQYVGIFVDMTSHVRNAERLSALRTQTQGQAKELLDHQLSMAQQIAKLLGESSARGESLVRALLALTSEQDGGAPDGWRDIYTSK